MNFEHSTTAEQVLDAVGEILSILSTQYHSTVVRIILAQFGVDNAFALSDSDDQFHIAIAKWTPNKQLEFEIERMLIFYDITVSFSPLEDQIEQWT